MDGTQKPDPKTLLEEKKWRATAKMFDNRKIFSEEEDSLIWNKESDRPDWSKFKSIVTDK
jgi:hypothetical protein